MSPTRPLHRARRLPLIIALMALPSLSSARPPDDIARHRATMEGLAGQEHARAVSREIGQLRSWIDEASGQWRRGDRAGLELTLQRLDAQEELVRAMLQAAKARAALNRSQDDLAAVRHQIQAERERYEAMRSFLEGGE